MTVKQIQTVSKYRPVAKVNQYLDSNTNLMTGQTCPLIRDSHCEYEVFDKEVKRMFKIKKIIAYEQKKFHKAMARQASFLDAEMKRLKMEWWPQ